MKAFLFVTVLAAGIAFIAAPAEAAKKRKPGPVPHAAIAKSESYVVRDHDGEILGQDPDPFIRLMIRKDGKIRDQQGL